MFTTPGIQVEEESSDGVRLPKDKVTPCRREPHIDCSGAYTIVLRLEDDSFKVDDSRKLVYTRTLGCLIREGPTDQARANVAQVVISCHTNQEK
jgi:hypothetical protein